MALTKSARLEAIDVLRGLVMVIMALDHTRDFFSNASRTIAYAFEKYSG